MNTLPQRSPFYQLYGAYRPLLVSCPVQLSRRPANLSVADPEGRIGGGAGSRKRRRQSYRLCQRRVVVARHWRGGPTRTLTPKVVRPDSVGPGQKVHVPTTSITGGGQRSDGLGEPGGLNGDGTLDVIASGRLWPGRVRVRLDRDPASSCCGRAVGVRLAPAPSHYPMSNAKGGPEALAGNNRTRKLTPSR